tara:strand:+ start:3355 stop:3558 length:204 start_codon:yes stop_codon:yes gene_type:complete
MDRVIYRFENKQKVVEAVTEQGFIDEVQSNITGFEQVTSAEEIVERFNKSIAEEGQPYHVSYLRAVK